MTSITYGHGFLTDCEDTTGWTEKSSPTLTDTALTVLHDDWFQLTGTATDANQLTYWEYDVTDISSDVYRKFKIRAKTSTAATGLQAYATLEFTSGNQVILPLTFSTTWTVVSGTITSGKTIDKVRLQAHSDAACSGEYVLYDYLLLYKDDFPFPNVAYGLNFTPPVRQAFLSIPGRGGDLTQQLGTSSATVTASCDLDIGTWTITPQGQTFHVPAQVFMDIAHNSGTEPWQWLDTGQEQFKVTVDQPAFRRVITGNTSTHVLDLAFHEYPRSSASNQTCVERFGLNL